MSEKFNSKLLPCPFCGAMPASRCSTRHAEIVMCERVGCPIYCNDMPVKLWNTRASTPPLNTVDDLVLLLQNNCFGYVSKQDLARIIGIVRGGDVKLMNPYCTQPIIDPHTGSQSIPETLSGESRGKSPPLTPRELEKAIEYVTDFFNGVADLAMKHRDIAEARVKELELLAEKQNEALKAIGCFTRHDSQCEAMHRTVVSALDPLSSLCDCGLRKASISLQEALTLAQQAGIGKSLPEK